MNAREWIDAYAEELATQAPSAEDFKELLDLAAVAAHSSERIAAPIACFLAGRDGRPIPELREIAERVAPPDDAPG